MALADAFVAEMEMESAATRRVLERVPEAHLAWRPHDKSSSLGQLALHVASLPRPLTAFVAGDSLDVTAIDTRQPSPASCDEILRTFHGSVSAARASQADRGGDTGD